MRAYLLVLGIVLAALFLIGIVILNFNRGDQPLAFSPSEVPAASVGQPYDVSIEVVGNAGPVDFIRVDSAATALPPGITLEVTEDDSGDVTDAHLRGTPTTAGTYRFTVDASTVARGIGPFQFQVSSQTGEQQYTLAVN